MTPERENGNIYFIDTSALIRGLADSLWEKLEQLFLNDKMFSHQIVYDQITTDSKRPDLLSKRITPLQKYFKPMTVEQAQLVSGIIKRFPALIESDNEKEQADPWLIASALLEQNQLSLFNPNKKVYIVSEESEIKQNRIPDVANAFGLTHLNLPSFLSIE